MAQSIIGLQRASRHSRAIRRPVPFQSRANVRPRRDATMSEVNIRRIVVACDPAGENRSSIEAAARFAAWWDVTVHGLFVQDEGLLNLAALPFARHVGPSGSSEEVDVATILHQFEAHAGRVRTMLKTAAREHAIGWSFDVVRGQPTLATLCLAEQDLLVIEATSRPFVHDFRLDSRWLATAFEAQRSTLLIRNYNLRDDGVVALVQSPKPSAERLIAVAAGLALASDRRLTIILNGPTLEERAVIDRVRHVSAKVAANCRFEQSKDLSLSLERLAGEGSVLIVDAAPAINTIAKLREFAAHSRGDLLFLR